METITLKVQSKHFQFFLELIQKFSFVEVVKKEENIEEYIPRNKEQLKSDLREALSEAKMAAEGKIQLQTWDEFKRELAHEL